MNPSSTPAPAASSVVPPAPSPGQTLRDDPTIGEVTGQRLHYNAFVHFLARFAREAEATAATAGSAAAPPSAWASSAPSASSSPVSPGSAS